MPNRSIATGSDAAHVRGIWAALSFYHSGATAWGRSSDKRVIEGVDAKVVDLLPEFAAAVPVTATNRCRLGRDTGGSRARPNVGVTAASKSTNDRVQTA